MPHLLTLEDWHVRKFPNHMMDPPELAKKTKPNLGEELYFQAVRRSYCLIIVHKALPFWLELILQLCRWGGLVTV